MISFTSPWLAAVFVWVSGFVSSDAELLLHSRSARREIVTYRSYRDVTLLPYFIPEQASVVFFNFTVHEEEIYVGVNKCPQRNVTVVLKPGSFPVINPDGAAFPKQFWNLRVFQHSAEFSTNTKNYIIRINNPSPGDWYAAVFLSYTDPNADRILQQGLTSSCIALMESSMNVTLADNVTTLAVHQPTERKVDSSGGILEYFKFYVPNFVWKVHINLTVDYCKPVCPSLDLFAEAFQLPSTELSNSTSSATAHCSSEQIVRGDGCSLQFMPSEEAWHYLAISGAPSKKSGKTSQLFSYTIEVTFDEDNSEVLFIKNRTREWNENATVECIECWPRVPLMRQNYPAFFTYNFVRVPEGSAKPSSSVNITTKSPTIFKSEIHSVKDIGGTLTFELRLDKDPKFENVTKQLYNVSVVSCVSYRTRSEPIFPGKCVSNSGAVSNASVVVNSTSSAGSTGRILVPYPEPGRWYITLKPFCFLENNSSEGIETNCSGLSFVTVSFVIDSDSCGPDSCGKYGTCLNFMSGGVIYSTCICEHGYRGWGCTDDSRVTPLYQLLVAALLLTLSNLLFIPAIVIALRRKLWTESFVYSCTMFFSTFYHACEAGEDVYSYCIMRLNVLQFCDFYTAILALWVTVLSMADLPSTSKSLAHMVGAVGIALGTEYDRTSLAVFMIPTVIGLSILAFQWGTRCWRQRACYPKRRYWLFYFPFGVLLVLIGISCYSFLQTRNNYKYVHSAWHAIVAISIIFLLPMKKYTEIQYEESDYSMSSSTRPFWTAKGFWFCKLCRRD